MLNKQRNRIFMYHHFRLNILLSLSSLTCENKRNQRKKKGIYKHILSFSIKPSLCSIKHSMLHIQQPLNHQAPTKICVFSNLTCRKKIVKFTFLVELCCYKRDKKNWMHLVAHSEPRSSCKPLTTKTENLRLCMTSVDANVSCFVRGYLEKQLTIAWMLINRDATYAKLEDICCYQTKPLLGF